MGKTVWCYLCILVSGLMACSETEEKVPVKESKYLQLTLPEIADGIRFDSSNAFVRISGIYDTSGTLVDYSVLIDSARLDTSRIVNIYADHQIASGIVDSIVDTLCQGKDLRLIGLVNGEPLSIPFHTLHRFAPTNYIDGLFENQYLILHMNDSGLHYGGKFLSESDFKQWVNLFYGNAFDPHDSSKFPQRKGNENTIIRLMQEGQAWDESPHRIDSPDSAVYLAAYNEFVNRLEIFDKVGPFYALNLAFFEIEIEPQTKWGDVMKSFALHLAVQKLLRQSAVRYFEDRHANSGAEKKKDLTEEDLQVLYPDRLRWNHRMSGSTEHRYDVHHLEVNKHVFPPPAAVLPVEHDQLDDVPLN
jgi:hypothetical protein